jgi:hypothetical protein
MNTVKLIRFWNVVHSSPSGRVLSGNILASKIRKLVSVFLLTWPGAFHNNCEVKFTDPLGGCEELLMKIVLY